MAFRPDGRVLAFGDSKGKVRLFDLVARKEVRSFVGDATEVRRMQFSRDGRRRPVVNGGEVAGRVTIWDVSDVKVLPVVDANPDIETWTKALADPDPVRATDAAWRLVAHPDLTVTALMKATDAAEPLSPEAISKLIAQLDSDDFRTRERATRDLVSAGSVGSVGRKFVEAALENPVSPKQKLRLEEVMKKLKAATVGPEALFASRAVFVLERIGTPDANSLLKSLAKRRGRLGDEATVALSRRYSTRAPCRRGKIT